MIYCSIVLFFKQKTAYEMRISDWSSDVCSSDLPMKVPDAKRYEQLSYMDVLRHDLKVMDASAISLARENHIPILVFSIHNNGAFADVVRGEGRFTIITE